MSCVQSGRVVAWLGAWFSKGLICTLFVWCECECKFGRRMGWEGRGALPGSPGVVWPGTHSVVAD